MSENKTLTYPSNYEFEVSFDLIDAGNVVYHPNYLILLERARYDYCKKIGINITNHFSDGFAFAVAETKLQYRAPLFLEQKYEIKSEILKVSRKIITFSQKILHKGKEIFTAQLLLVHVKIPEMKSVSIPESMIQSFKKYSLEEEACNPNCKLI